ncbi:MAG: MBL fold metallo-hydrolase [Verrucomicrobiota bacterium]|nr:MBL fold metallo-hydrolase [Verrucomicrobiota bacterium]MEC9328037.1 MBL fold metallo-hydrolase [Verrucomicrobiota bacterium]MEE2723964.1 MBL fold metallo-hydrolase [Verrucomicrobiota bacterium]
MLSFISLGSGSSGNSALVYTEKTFVLVDAGISAKQLRIRLKDVGVDPDKLDGILITHEHGDHTKGLEVFCRKLDVPIYCNAVTRESLSLNVSSAESWRIIECGDPFSVGDILINGFPVMHDAVDPMGFIFEKNGKKLGFVSDVGHVTEVMKSTLSVVDTIFIEANYDETLLQNDERRPWSLKQRIASRHGHLSNKQVAELVGSIAGGGMLQRVVLAHLSADCNSPEIAKAEIILALSMKGISGVEVICAKRNQVSGPFMVECSDEKDAQFYEGGDYSQGEFILFD